MPNMAFGLLTWMGLDARVSRWSLSSLFIWDGCSWRIEVERIDLAFFRTFESLRLLCSTEVRWLSSNRTLRFSLCRSLYWACNWFCSWLFIFFLSCRVALELILSLSKKLFSFDFFPAMSLDPIIYMCPSRWWNGLCTWSAWKDLLLFCLPINCSCLVDWPRSAP